MVGLLLAGCTPRLEFRESSLPVLPLDNFHPDPTDTTLVGTIVMLSDKLAAFDVVEIVGDSAFRRARVLFDRPVETYHGGALKVRLRPLETGVTRYMIRAQLLDWEEIPLAREVTREYVEIILKKHHARLERLIKEQGEEGEEGWEPDGVLTLEGYDFQKRIAIYSMPGRAAILSFAEKEPLLVVWADESGKIVKIYLTVITRRLERS